MRFGAGLPIALRATTTGLLAAGLLATGLLAGGPASAAQFWLAGVDPFNQRAKHFGPADYMQLFGPDAPWQQAASRLNVFKISAQFVLGGDETMLHTLFADLHRRHVAVAVESAALVRSPECGFGEGMARPELLDRLGTRLKSLNLQLDYLAMDEPVWYGHEKSWGRNVCAYPVSVVADRVAQGVAQIRRYFPNLPVGEIDVVTDRIEAGQLAADYAQFAQLFAQRTGTKLAFFHADVAWRSDFHAALPAIGRQMHRMGVRFGVIIGGGGHAGDDEDVLGSAMQRLQFLQSNPATRLDDVVVQSWQPLPDRMLPETQPGTYTNILMQAEKSVQ